MYEQCFASFGDAYANALKKQRVCVKDGLDSFNWILNIPLENSHASQGSENPEATFVSTPAGVEVNKIKDIRAPMIEM